MSIMKDGVVYSDEPRGYIITGRDDTLVAKNIVLPEEINGIPVVGIWPRAFRESKIETILIPDSVEFIDISAFEGSKELTHVEFYPTKKASGNLHLWASVFRNCPNLQTITNPTQRIYCKHYAFQDCPSLIKIQAQFGYLDGYVFLNSDRLRTIHVADRGTWNPNAFQDSKISELHFAGKIHASKDSLQAIWAKHWVCTKDFNYLDAVYDGVSIHVKD